MSKPKLVESNEPATLGGVMESLEERLANLQVAVEKSFSEYHACRGAIGETQHMIEQLSALKAGSA